MPVLCSKRIKKKKKRSVKKKMNKKKSNHPMEEKKNKGGFKKKLLHVCPVQQSAQKAYGQQYDHVAREISVKRTGLDMTILWDVPTLTLMTHIRGIIWKFDSEGKGRIMMIRCVFWKNVVL